MSNENFSLQTRSPAALSFAGILCWGAMLATLLIIAYAYLASPEALVRAHIILQGAEVLLISLGAGVIAGSVHQLALGLEARRKAFEGAASRQRLTV